MPQLSTSWTKLNTYSFDTYGFSGEFSLWAKIIDTEVANNRTKVAYDWDLTITYGWQKSYDAQDYVSGAGWNDATYREYTSSGTLRSGSEWINHANDGTGSGTCYGRTRMGGMNFDTDWVSGSYTLPTIPRASVPSATPNPITLSATTNTLTVNTNRKANIFTHTVTCAIGSYSETKTDITESTTFGIPKTVLADFAANETTLAGTITCVTYNGNTNIGTKTATFTAQINTTQERPKINSITLTDTNPKSAAIESAGTYIKYATNLRAVIALGVDGSYTQLASAVVQCGNSQRTYALSGTTQTITYTYEKLDADSLIITVYDKRGTARTQTKTWQLVPYRDITVTGAVDRTSETGNVIAFNLTGACFAGSFGNTSNQVAVTYKYKLHSATTWLDGAETFTFTPSGTGETTYTYSNTLAGFSYDQQYDIVFTVEDMFTTASTRELVLTVGIPVYGNGADFFTIYGKQYLHFDRDNPSKFWDIKAGLDTILKYHACTNLINNTATTQTLNGLAFTVNADGSVHVQNTATANTYFKVGTFTSIAGISYVLTGCPSGGEQGTYGLELYPVSSVPMSPFYDYGDGYAFTEQTDFTYEISIVIWSGQTVGLTFYPMVRDAGIATDAYVPAANNNGYEITTWLNGWRTNGQSYWQRIGNMVYMQVTMRDGTTTSGTNAITLPYEAAATVITGMLSTSGINGYARVSGTTLAVYDVSTNTNCMFQIAYKIK